MADDSIIRDPLHIDAISRLVVTALGVVPHEISRVARGSTNLVYRATADGQPIIIKIAHRPDRQDTGILEKEGRFLRAFESLKGLADFIPRILWQGRTPQGWPTLIMTELPGSCIANLITPDVDVRHAGAQLGELLASLHQNKHPVIDEFETDRKPYASFPDYARYWLSQWRPLCEQASFISPKDIQRAFEKVLQGLDAFDEKIFAHIHGDISQENLLGKVVDGELQLTGLCDFENIQTGPSEYDFATMYNGIFLYYPQIEQQVFEAYTALQPLHPQYERRIVTMNLFRALRYIKRVVKYDESHYHKKGKEYIEAWIDR